MTQFCYFCIIMTSQLHNYHLENIFFSICINCYQGLPLCKILASKHNHIKSYDRKTNFTPPWKYDIFGSLLKIALPLFRPISGILPIYRTSDYLFSVIQTWTLPFLMRKLGDIKMFTKALSDPGQFISLVFINKTFFVESFWYHWKVQEATCIRWRHRESPIQISRKITRSYKWI